MTWEKEGEDWKEQRLCYSVVKREMIQRGWKNPTGQMVKTYSYLGPVGFMALIENADLYADREAEYYNRKGMNVKPNTPEYAQFHLIRRLSFCRMFNEQVAKAKKRDIDFDFTVWNEQEIDDRIRHANVGLSLTNQLEQMRKGFQKREGSDLEFGN